VSCKTLIVHGRSDLTVPVEYSRRYVGEGADRALVELDDDHSLLDSIGRIGDLALEFFDPRTRKEPSRARPGADPMSEASLACPKCRAPLLHLERRGMIIERCSKCAGLWFDAGELTVFTESYKKIDSEAGAPSGLGCLRCDHELRVLSFPGTDVEIDRCPGCQGIWLDQGELELLQRQLGSRGTDRDHNYHDRACEILSEVERVGREAVRCPRCEGKLWHLTRKGLVVEMCSRCEGMWFDAGELTVILSVYKDIGSVKGKPSGLKCLRCETVLDELPYPGTSVVIDRCPSCQGVWLDRGELEDLKAALMIAEGADQVEGWRDRAQAFLDEAGSMAEQRVCCPKCSGNLEDIVREGLPLERCYDCDGTWFDAGELAVVLGVSRRVRLTGARATELRCIKCPAELLVELPYPGTEVDIDTCPDCRGIWLDGGELKALATALGVSAP
jgi:uncharacterized protein